MEKTLLENEEIIDYYRRESMGEESRFVDHLRSAADRVMRDPAGRESDHEYFNTKNTPLF